MANQITGRIYNICQTFNVETRNGSFLKREVWVTPMMFDRYTGEPTISDPKYSVCFEFTRDNCKDVDSFKVGDDVVIPFNLRGNVYEKDGMPKCITSIEGLAIRPYQRGTTTVVVNEPQEVAQEQPAQQPVAPSPAPAPRNESLPF